MNSRVIVACVAMLVGMVASAAATYVVVDTGQERCFDDALEITCPASGEPFYGQDSQYDGTQPSFTLSGDGLTVDDGNTGLTWQQAPDTNGDGEIDSDDKLSWVQFQNHPATLNAQNFGGYDDWRVPTIKELYSLIDFSGIDPSGYTGPTSGLIPFIDTNYFAFAYGDESTGERIIDAQYWSGTQYVGTVFGDEPAVFGVNFADGRIKGYPRDNGPGGTMTQFARYVRGNADYGINDFVDNGDGTIIDSSTGLMWMQADNGTGVIWEDALSFAENLDFAGRDDWRLPNAKELQSIVDYTRSPTTTGSAAIDPLFDCTQIIDEAGNPNYAFYWTSTTHINWTTTPGGSAAYIAFGQALGYFGPPGMEQWCDVHGAGAQRSDPKSGDPSQWPYGHGPQGDAIRIYNYVRCVRDVAYGDVNDEEKPEEFGMRAVPNPTFGATTIHFNQPGDEQITLAIHGPGGRLLRILPGETGSRSLLWDGADGVGRPVPPGVYFARLTAQPHTAAMRVTVLR